MQLRQIDDETGEIFVLDRTEALSKDLQDFWAADCRHIETKIVTVIISGGSKQIRRQCLTCGQRQGNPMKQAGFDEVPSPEDGSIAVAYERERQKQLHNHLPTSHSKAESRQVRL
jgi:hypothetical protein